MRVLGHVRCRLAIEPLLHHGLRVIIERMEYPDIVTLKIPIWRIHQDSQICRCKYERIHHRPLYEFSHYVLKTRPGKDERNRT